MIKKDTLIGKKIVFNKDDSKTEFTVSGNDENGVYLKEMPGLLINFDFFSFIYPENEIDYIKLDIKHKLTKNPYIVCGDEIVNIFAYEVLFDPIQGVGVSICIDNNTTKKHNCDFLINYESLDSYLRTQEEYLEYIKNRNSLRLQKSDKIIFSRNETEQTRKYTLIDGKSYHIENFMYDIENKIYFVEVIDEKGSYVILHLKKVIFDYDKEIIDDKQDASKTQKDFEKINNTFLKEIGLLFGQDLSKNIDKEENRKALETFKLLKEIFEK